MASTKRNRDEHDSVGWESYAKHGRQQQPITNGYAIMMQAARQLANKPNQPDATQGHVPSLTTQQQGRGSVPCTHCGKRLLESQLAQCTHCQDVFCSTCSVTNYDSWEDRVFCLDCHGHQGAGTTARSSMFAHPTSTGVGAMSASWSATSPFRSIGNQAQLSPMPCGPLANFCSPSAQQHYTASPWTNAITPSGLRF